MRIQQLGQSVNGNAVYAGTALVGNDFLCCLIDHQYCTLHERILSSFAFEGEENFVGDSEIIALGGASNETKDRPLG